MLRNIKKRSEGFTIIEVLIVLAIAGLIMLIVFLAVPALQRNQRNNARNAEAARIAAAVNECLSNRNGVVGSCDSDGEIEQGQTTQLNAINLVTTDTFSQTDASLYFNRACNNAGTASVAGSSSRQFVILFQLEPNVNRCISS